jgi:hypothetical protein
MLMMQPEAKAFMEKLLHFEKILASLLAVIAETSSIVPLRIPIENMPIEKIYETVIRNEESK